MIILLSFHSFNFLRLIDEKFFGSGFPSMSVRRIIFFFLSFLSASIISNIPLSFKILE